MDFFKESTRQHYYYHCKHGTVMLITDKVISNYEIISVLKKYSQNIDSDSFAPSTSKFTYWLLKLHQSFSPLLVHKHTHTHTHKHTHTHGAIRLILIAFVVENCQKLESQLNSLIR